MKSIIFIFGCGQYYYFRLLVVDREEAGQMEWVAIPGLLIDRDLGELRVRKDLTRLDDLEDSHAVTRVIRAHARAPPASQCFWTGQSLSETSRWLPRAYLFAHRRSPGLRKHGQS